MNLVKLTFSEHKKIKFKSQNDSKIKSSRVCIVYPQELFNVIKIAPVFLSKIPNSNIFVFVALLGLEEGENLFFDDLCGSDLFLDFYRLPFYVNNETKSFSLENEDIYIDLNSEAISEVEGEPIFLDDENFSLSFLKIKDTLKKVIEGAALTKQLSSLFTNLNLIEPSTLNVELITGENITLDGLYSINNEKLLMLNNDVIIDLHKKNIFPILNFVSHSVSNITNLIDKKNKLIKGCNG